MRTLEAEVGLLSGGEFGMQCTTDSAVPRRMDEVERIREYLCNAGQLFYRMRLPEDFVDVEDRDWVPDVGLSKVLYHYASPKAFHGIAMSSLEGEPFSTVRRIHATYYQCLNDENEIGFGFEIVDKVIEEFGAYIPEPVAMKLRPLLARLKEQAIYLVCFSETYGSLSQWRAYANNAAGYCLGVRVSPAQPRGSHGVNAFRCLFKCIYGEDAVRAELMTSLRNKLARQVTLKGKFQGMDEVSLFAAELAMVAWRYAHLAKHEHFKDEVEWRCVAYPEPGGGPRYRLSDRGLIPYIEIPMAIEQVWIGPRIWPSGDTAVEGVQTVLPGVPPNQIKCWASPYRHP
jgi:hypothetical protein